MCCVKGIGHQAEKENGIEEGIEQVESLKQKLRLEALDVSCQIIEENTQRGPGYRFVGLDK